MDSVFNIDMADGSNVSNIIFDDSGSKWKVRGHSLTPSKTRAGSIMPSIELNSGDESYQDKV